MTSTAARSGMPGHFGIRITDADKDKLVGELDVDDRHLNNSGHVHGGALAAFADDLGGALAGLNVPPGFRTTTIESKTNIFRACVPGRLTGVAVPVHVGRRTIVLQTSIYRADGKLAAMMIQTQMVLPGGRPHLRVKMAVRVSALIEMNQGISVGYSLFPRTRESKAPKARQPHWTPLSRRFRGGDDTLLITLASFQLRASAKIRS